jgi:hypothetical protein
MAPSNWSFVIAAYTVATVVIGTYWIAMHRALRRGREAYRRAAGPGARAGGSP